MSISFIPNDPRGGSGAPPRRTKAPRPGRPAGSAGFRFHDPAPEGVHARGTPGFLYWQCREAALAALAAWEGHVGRIASWQAGSKIDLWQNSVAQRGARPDLNAYYDRAGLEFFEYDDGGKRTLSGESTDVVAHETGHGVLDAIRPDLWDSPYLEAAAFHEAFADCVAILAALADAPTLTALAKKGPGRRNFVETTAEDLSYAIRRIAPQHNAAEPRRALNKLRWQLPSTLPGDGGPGALINESHSFARVFTGCIWDLFVSVAGRNPTAARMRKAARTVARLLAAGARDAPEGPRLFQAIGRTMTLADGTLDGGANRAAIHDAFANHGIALGSNALLAPISGLAGPEPSVAATRASLASDTVADLAARLRSPGARVEVRSRRLAGRAVAEARHRREIDLVSVSPRLRGVVALAPEAVLVGASGARAAVLGGLPDPASTAEDVRAYVSGLLDRGRIQLERRATVKVRGAAVPAWFSHTVREARGRKVLARVRFSCGPGA